MLTLTGTVKDKSTQEAMPYASIFVSDSNGEITDQSLGTQTDDNGNFSFDVPINQGHLTFSFVGYSRITKPFSRANTNINFDPKSTSTSLGTVEIIGQLERAKTALMQRRWWLYATAGIGLISFLKGIGVFGLTK